MLRWIGLFLLIIPALLWGIAFALGPAHTWYAAIWRLGLGSQIAGVLLLINLLGLLLIEFIQDSYLDWNYRKNQAQRIRLEGSIYECQYCGSRQVRVHDRRCPTCGKELQPDKTEHLPSNK